MTEETVINNFYIREIEEEEYAALMSFTNKLYDCITCEDVEDV